MGLALHRRRRADFGRLGLAIGLADPAMASATTEMDTTTPTEEDGSPDMQLGNYEGNTSIEVPGEDLNPTDTAGWTTTGKRNKQQATPSTGESPAIDRPSRPRERASYAKRIATALTKAARMPQVLPKNDIKIIVRPRGGLNLARTEATIVMSALLASSGVSKQDASADTICNNNAQNIIVISTPCQQRAMQYLRMKTLFIGGKTYKICTYQAAEEDTAKGVIRGVAIEDTPQDINANIVNSANPLAQQAHRIGNTTTVIVLFEGHKVPNYVKYGPLLLKCSLYRKHFDVCRQCGKIGHRGDVCPFPDTRVCIACGAANPNAEHADHCKPRCQLCNGSHVTGAKECANRYKIPYIVKRRQWERKLQGDQQRQQQLRKPPALDLEDSHFPPLRQPSTDKNSRCRSKSRSNSQQRGNGSRQRSVSRNSQPSQSKERVAWADALKTPAMQVYRPTQESATLKALRTENEQMKQKIKSLEQINRDIQEKMNQLISIQQRSQQSPPTPAPIPTPTAVTPSTSQGDSEPTTKKRAMDLSSTLREKKWQAQQDKLEARVTALEDRFEAFSKETTDHFQQIQTMLLRIQAQLNTLVPPQESHIEHAVPPPMIPSVPTTLGQPTMSLPQVPPPVRYQSWPPQ